jgi:mRNA-degrading endonuclease YafQ of YafQ-DinJ toxin-antitoxin module
MDEPFRNLNFTETFLSSFGSRTFTTADRAAIRKALRLLDANERHPSLRVHGLQGDLAGLWSVSASASLRLTFIRAEQGRKTMLTCTKHYAN